MIKLEHQKKALGEKSGVQPALRPCWWQFETGGMFTCSAHLRDHLAGSGCRWCHFSVSLFFSKYLLSVLCGRHCFRQVHHPCGI